MKKLIIFFCLTVFTSCSIKYFTTNKDYWRPIDNNVFTYKKNNFRLNNSIIDTTKIYCKAVPEENPKYFECYRFFSTGQVLSYSFRTKIDTTAFSNINIGGVGYYHIKKNIIRIQQFTVYAEHFTKGGGGALIHNYATIKNDSIIMDHEHIGKNYYANRNILEGGYKLIYKKTKIEAPKLKPIW